MTPSKNTAHPWGEELERRLTPSVAREKPNLIPDLADHGKKPDMVHLFEMEEARHHAQQEKDHGVGHFDFHDATAHALGHSPELHSAVHPHDSSSHGLVDAIHQHVDSEELPLRQKKLKLAADFVNGPMSFDEFMLKYPDLLSQDETNKLLALRESQKDGYRETFMPNDIRLEIIIM